ncbi:MAG: META domain-containing protein [Algibacter sp.]
MKSILMVFSIVVLRCCWGPTDLGLMLNLQNDNTLLKELNGNYNITGLNNEDVSSFKLNIAFNKEENQVSGFSGCNRFFGSYTLGTHNLKFAPLGLTKMICKGEQNDIETKLLKAFEKANLVLFTKNGFQIYNKKKLLITAIKEIVNDALVFEYSTSTRGAYKAIKIDSSTISISNKRSSKPIGKDYSKEKWDTLLIQLEAIDLDGLSSLIPPSKDHQFDGAALAHFKITKGNKTYEVQPFDHGKPHPVIEPLVKEMVSISENIE